MHEHIEMLMAAMATALRRDGRPRRREARTRGPRRARGTFVPVAPAMPAGAKLRPAH
ncbi:hypothetical protein ACFQ0P_05035 [Microbacterium insulae]|uniref:Uncharacterized protein n=1 Tax=Microbacterium insulae TaxID=483014 RepID=A0ABW3AFK6_9MICO